MPLISQTFSQKYCWISKFSRMWRWFGIRVTSQQFASLYHPLVFVLFFFWFCFYFVLFLFPYFWSTFVSSTSLNCFLLFTTKHLLKPPDYENRTHSIERTSYLPCHCILPFPLQVYPFSVFCVSKQRGHEQDEVSLAVLLFCRAQKVYDISCRKILYELAKVIVRTCPKNILHSVCSSCLLTSSALCIQGYS